MYRRNFLTNVIVRAVFHPPVIKLRTEPPAQVQNEVRLELPEWREVADRHLSVHLAESRAEFGESRRWIMSRPDDMALTISESTFSVELNRYTSQEDLTQKWNRFFGIFRRHYDLTELKQLGLRYINQVRVSEGHPLDWRGLINPHLLVDWENGIYEPQALLRSLHESHLCHDDWRVVFRYGLFNPEYPSPVCRKEFILDYDCHRAGEMEVENAENLILEAHAIIENLFESSICQGLRDIMEAVE